MAVSDRMEDDELDAEEREALELTEDDLLEMLKHSTPARGARRMPLRMRFRRWRKRVGAARQRRSDLRHRA